MRSSEPIWFAPQRKGRHGWIVFKDSPSPPPAPNYVGAAQAQGQANKDTAIATAQLSNPNVTTPYGSQSVSYSLDPTTGNPVPNVTQTLSPDQQALYTSQNKMSQQLAGIGQQGLDAIGGTLSKPIDASNAQAATEQAYNNFKSRLDPQWAQNSESHASQLANQGITQGSEAYDNSMRTFNQGKNDAYQQAQNSAQQFAPQTQQMDIAGRDALLNELNAVRTGSQVQTPQFQGYQGAQIGQTPIMQGAQAQGSALQNMYNAQLGASNSQTSGLYGLGGAALTALALA